VNPSPRMAMIGLGVMASRMITNMNNHGDFDITAGWDPSPDACGRIKTLEPGIRIGASAAEIIAADDTDFVYIATPPAFHREYAEAAIKAAKPVLCEKPLGVDIAESRGLTALAERREAPNAVNFPFAAAAAVQAIEAALKDGTIGEVKAVDIRLHFCKWPRDWQEPAAWLSERAQGGFVRETFSHYAYLSEKLFGPATLINAINRYPDDAVSAETHALALLNCRGIPVTFAGGTGGIDASGADRVDFTVWGTNSAYRLYDWNRLQASTGDGWTDQLTNIADPRQEGYRLQMANLGQFLAGNEHTMATFRDALHVQELVEKILAA